MIENPNASNRVYDGEVITPSDTVKNQWDCYYVGTSGDITLKYPGKSTTTLYSNVPIGFFPVSADYIMNTGTTASNILGQRVFDKA
jgi:hypothetical protein